MKINMKLVGVSALALVLCGCGGGSEKYAAPKVAEGAIVALEFNQQQIDKIQAAALGEKGESLTKKAWEEAPKELVEVVKAAGLENVKVRWGVLSAGEPTLKENMNLKNVPDVALAIAVDIDIERTVAAIREQQKKENADDVAMIDATVAGVKAWKIVDKGGNLAKAKAEPCFTALDGKLFLAASSLAVLEKQIMLYRDGKGESSAFADFAFADDDLFRLKLTDIGSAVKKSVPNPKKTLKMLTMFVPNVDEILLGLGALDFSATATADNGVALAFKLAAASEKDADQLRTLAKTGLMPLTAQLQEDAKEDADAKRQLALIEGLKIAGAEGKFEATLTVPGTVLKEFVAEAAKELR